MKRIFYMLAVLWLAAGSAHAQFVWAASSLVSGVTGSLLTTNFAAGLFRVTVHSFIDETNAADLSDGTVRMTTYDPRDGKTITTATTRVSASAHRAESSLSASPEPYTLQFWLSGPDTNIEPSVIYWASVTVTSAPSAGGGGVALNVRSIEGDYVGAVTGSYGSLSVTGTLVVGGNLDVSGAITAVDTSKVALVGETNPVNLTTTTVALADPTADAHGVTRSWFQARALTNGGATVNGQIFSNGAAISIPAGGLTIFAETTGLPTQAGAYLYPTSQPTIGVFAGTNKSLAATRPDGAAAGGNARGAGAVDWQITKGSANQVASAADSTIGGGSGNRADGAQSTIAGGAGNLVTSPYGAIAGGNQNNVLNEDSGGISSEGSSIGGGSLNIVYGRELNTVAGGYQNVIGNTRFAFIGGGLWNTNSGNAASILGGVENAIGTNAAGSSVIGGRANRIESNTLYSAIVNGYGNTIRANKTNAFILAGSGVTATNDNYAHIGTVMISLIGTAAPARARAIAMEVEGLYICRTNGTWELQTTP